jgi:hypothetical protein
LPFEMPFSGRTIFGKGLNGTQSNVYPGIYSDPIISTWTDPNMTAWAMMRVMQRKVIR